MLKRIFPFRNQTSKFQTFAYFSAYFALGGVISSLGPTLHYLSANVHASFDKIGLTFSVRSAGYLIGSFLLGRLFDKYPGHKILLGLLLTSALLLVAIPWTSTLVWLLIIIFIMGIMLGGIDVGSNTLLTWLHGHKSGAFLTAMFFFAGLGSFFSPLIVSFFDKTQNGYIFSYLVIGLLLIPGIILTLKTPSPPIKHKARDETEAPLPIIPFVGFAILFMLYVGAEVSFGGWIHTFVTNSKLGDTQTASLINSVFWSAITIGRLLMIPIATRFSPQKLTFSCLTAALFSIGIILLFPHSLLAVWCMTIGVGLSIASLFPITFSITERMIKITGTRNGILWASGSAGAILFPWLIGREFQTIGSKAFPHMLLFLWGSSLLVFLGIIFYRKFVSNKSPQ